MAKRFAKRARMQRLEEMYGDSPEFSQQRLIDEDASMKEDLSKMRCGLLRRSSSLSRASSLSRSSSFSRSSSLSRSGSISNLGPSTGIVQKTTGSLSIALGASKKRKHRTSFLGGSQAVNRKEVTGANKPLSLDPVVFNSQSGLSNSRQSVTAKKGKISEGSATTGSLFSNLSTNTKIRS